MQNPQSSTWKDPALSKLNRFCRDSRVLDQWVPVINLPERWSRERTAHCILFKSYCTRWYVWCLQRIPPNCPCTGWEENMEWCLTTRIRMTSIINKTRIKKKVNLNLTVMGVDSLLNRCRCIPETCSGRTTQQYGFTGLPGNDMVSHLPGKGTVLQETESCECSLARGEREKGIFFFFFTQGGSWQGRLQELGQREMDWTLPSRQVSFVRSTDSCLTGYSGIFENNF